MAHLVESSTIDPIGWGKKRTLIHEEHDGSIIIRSEVDATEIDAFNREMRKIAGKPGEVMNMVASIPTSVYLRIPQDIRDDDKALLRWIEKNRIDGDNWKTTDKILWRAS